MSDFSSNPILKYADFNNDKVITIGELKKLMSGSVDNFNNVINAFKARSNDYKIENVENIINSSKANNDPIDEKNYTIIETTLIEASSFIYGKNGQPRAVIEDGISLDIGDYVLKYSSKLLKTNENANFSYTEAKVAVQKLLDIPGDVLSFGGYSPLSVRKSLDLYLTILNVILLASKELVYGTVKNKYDKAVALLNGTTIKRDDLAKYAEYDKELAKTGLGFKKIFENIDAENLVFKKDAQIRSSLPGAPEELLELIYSSIGIQKDKEFDLLCPEKGILHTFRRKSNSYILDLGNCIKQYHHSEIFNGLVNAGKRTEALQYLTDNESELNEIGLNISKYKEYALLKLDLKIYCDAINLAPNEKSKKQECAKLRKFIDSHRKKMGESEYFNQLQLIQFVEKKYDEALKTLEQLGVVNNKLRDFVSLRSVAIIKAKLVDVLQKENGEGSARSFAKTYTKKYNIDYLSFVKSMIAKRNGKYDQAKDYFVTYRSTVPSTLTKQHASEQKELDTIELMIILEEAAISNDYKEAREFVLKRSEKHGRIWYLDNLKTIASNEKKYNEVVSILDELKKEEGTNKQVISKLIDSYLDVIAKQNSKVEFIANNDINESEVIVNGVSSNKIDRKTVDNVRTWLSVVLYPSEEFRSQPTYLQQNHPGGPLDILTCKALFNYQNRAGSPASNDALAKDLKKHSLGTSVKERPQAIISMLLK